MSEKYIPRLEQATPSHENDLSTDHHERIHKHKAEQAEKARQEKSAENVAKIQELARAEAQESHKIKTEATADTETDDLLGMQHSLKSTAYERMIGRVRHKLSKPDRAFSNLAHNPVIDKISAISTQTVARPSGLLGGSICAFLGSSIVFYYSKHYGFRYNYLMMFILFVGGFLVGATIELLVWLAYGRRKSHY